MRSAITNSASHPLSRSPALPLLLALGAAMLAAYARAQDDPAEEESPYRPGLVAKYTAAGGEPATRVDETIAFDCQAASPDPRLPPGKFAVNWTGRLWTQVAGQHRLAVYAGGGRFTLKLAGRKLLSGDAAEPRWFVSEPVELEFDRHPCEVTFEKRGEQARLGLFWSGPGFGLEPVPERFLMHDRQVSPAAEFERGRRLAAALRCGACHGGETGGPALPFPALDKLAGNLHPAWLVDWLAKPPEAEGDSRIVRRMPHFGLTRQEAADVAAWLVRLPPDAIEKRAGKEMEQKETKSAKGKSAKGKGKAPAIPSAEDGQKLFVTLGCLACHQQGELGESGLFGGGDLTKIAAKRPREFFARWLTDPAALNRHHRMPVFELTGNERESLALWLSGKAAGDAASEVGESGLGDAAEGEKLVKRFRCATCHALPGVEASPKPAGLKSLVAASDWTRSCAADADAQGARPGYRLAALDQSALKVYFTALPAAAKASAASRQAQGRDLLVELNCLACHAREGIDRATNALPVRLQDKLAAVVEQYDEFGKQVPAMTPPALNSVGDKLHDAALAEAIQRKGPPHRPYLMVRMPRYELTNEQLAALTAYFTVTDRIPRGSGVSPAQDTAGGTPAPRLVAAGPRLVTTDGFGCTSCHQVGTVLPDKAPLNARGPDLSLLDKRIRREWFDRWCNNPARIVPRMEMPSVQVPVRGVLDEKIGDQLAAVWHILNTPGFEPPEPNPVRVLRLSGVPEKKETPIVLHDVIKAGDKTYLFPLVIGLPNRHNILFDLETNRLAAWWLGDTARQRTKGKSWYWEAGSNPIFEMGGDDDELCLIVEGKELSPIRRGQFVSRTTSIEMGYERATFEYSIEFPPIDGREKTSPTRISMIQQWAPIHSSDPAATVHLRAIAWRQLPQDSTLRLRLVSRSLAKQCTWEKGPQILHLPGEPKRTVRVVTKSEMVWNGDGSVTFAKAPPGIRLEYSVYLPAEQYLAPSIPAIALDARELSIAPGFTARRLPLPDDIMPSAMSFRAQGRLVFATLKGQVYVASDTNADETFDRLDLVADGLPTPYGIHSYHYPENDTERGEPIDVLSKDGLWRLYPWEENWGASKRDLLGSGWGVTNDYHDWAVGLISGKNGEYFIGLPCQQDDRSEAAAKHRGELLKLVPRRPVPDDPHLPEHFDLEVVSSGHRFPMGLARNREGELFVTDNQGNYNPFNELNHVRQRAHFGFVNANEKEKGYKPPRHDKPAIDIPHPWTRSVNGICFLDTPVGLREPRRVGSAHHNSDGTDMVGIAHPTRFGPLEGHLIGCEYDTRQLIRMTLQKVGDTYQGAAYPLSIAPENVEDGLLGPIVCAVSPRGELYVGNIRDSGWGAGNNVGDIVQIKIEPEKLPCGIAEVRATKEGFTLDFFRPVDRAKAADPANYSLASYRRESTPAYGGPNLDRRIEKIASADVAADGKRVTLRLDNLREGFVYEFHLKPLVRGKELFHPAEAHYTLNRIP